MSANKSVSKRSQLHIVSTKSCFVPDCWNTSRNAPNKIFVCVPSDPQLRKEWYNAARHNARRKQDKQMLFCCEDHFDLEQDLQEDVHLKRWKLKRVFVKEHVVPHKFQCRAKTFTSMLRQRMSKLFSANIKTANTDDDATASTSKGFGCRNSSAKTPDKIFVTVPVAQKRREAWFAAVNRDVTEVSAISPRYCCEDHFDMEHDMDNYMEYRLSHVRARMRPDVVPHKYLDGNVPKKAKQRKKTKKQQAAVNKQVSVFVPVVTVTESDSVVVDVKQEDPLELDDVANPVLPTDLMDVQMKIEVEEEEEQSEFVAVKEERVCVLDGDDALL